MADAPRLLRQRGQLGGREPGARQSDGGAGPAKVVQCDGAFQRGRTQPRKKFGDAVGFIGFRRPRTAQLFAQNAQRVGHGAVLLGQGRAHGFGVDPGFLSAAVERERFGRRCAERCRVDAAGQLDGKVRSFQVAVLFQNRPERVHTVQRGGIFLLPAVLPPPAVGAEGVVGVVDDPSEALASVRKSIVNIVDRLRQRGQALGDGFQAGRCRRKAGALVRSGRFNDRDRRQPAFGEQRGGQQPCPGAEEQPKSISGRLDAEDAGHTAARIGGKSFDAASRGQQRRCCAGAGKPCGGRAKSRVCRAEGNAGHSAEGKGRFFLPPAAEGRFDGRTADDAQTDRPQRDAPKGRRPGGADEQRPDARFFRRRTPQSKADDRRQKSIGPAGEQQFDPAAGRPECEADRAQRQRSAPGQHGRAELSGPEPPCRHRRAYRAEQTDAVQRKRPKTVQQDAEHGPGGAGRETVLGKAQRQPQPERHQSVVQDGPAADEAGQQRRALPQGGPYRCPRHQRRRKGMGDIQFENIEHKRSPLSGGDFSLFCFPRLVHIL